MKFKLTISCDNDAFGEDEYDRAVEINSILHDISRRLMDHPTTNILIAQDSNGNNVGSAKFSKR